MQFRLNGKCDDCGCEWGRILRMDSQNSNMVCYSCGSFIRHIGITEMKAFDNEMIQQRQLVETLNNISQKLTEIEYKIKKSSSPVLYKSTMFDPCPGG